MLDAEDILLGREALIDELAEYKKRKSHHLTVVFDGGSAPPGTTRRQSEKGIQIWFSGPGQTADTVIKNMVRRERERALVVSSDREVISAAKACGAATIGAAEFENRLMEVMYDNYGGREEETDGGWIPTTKKKGPARRQSRRARFNRKKISKL